MHGCVVTVGGATVLAGEDASLDVMGAGDVEIVVSEDGKRMWVNTPQCRLRICQIKGTVAIRDQRPSPDLPENA